MKAYLLMPYLIMFVATLFFLWIIRKEEEPEIFFNTILVINCVILFIILFLGVFELCGCVM